MKKKERGVRSSFFTEFTQEDTGLRPKDKNRRFTQIKNTKFIHEGHEESQRMS
jgi:hypothetical protein